MGKKTWNLERVEIVLKNEEYKLISSSSDIGSRTELLVECPHGHQLTTNIYKFTVHKHRCKECKKLFKEKEKKSFINIIKLESNDEFEIISEYKSKLQPVLIKHNRCGRIWGVLPKKFIYDIRCSECNSKKQKKTHEEFVKEVFDIYKNEYTVVGTYISNRKKVLIKHNKCGHKWLINPRNFTINKRGCPKCKMSKGEMLIENILNKYGIIPERQFTFTNCKDKKMLPFDFKVGNILIEYDGELHYTEGRHSKNKEIMRKKLLSTQNHDNIKNNYCIKNNIPLVRIPYWQFDNIEYILTSILSYYNFIKKDNIDIDVINTFVINFSTNKLKQDN